MEKTAPEKGMGRGVGEEGRGELFIYIYVCVYVCVCTCMCACMSVCMSQNMVQRVSFRHELNEINEKVSFKMSAASLHMGANFSRYIS